MYLSSYERHCLLALNGALTGVTSCQGHRMTCLFPSPPLHEIEGKRMRHNQQHNPEQLNKHIEHKPFLNMGFLHT